MSAVAPGATVGYGASDDSAASVSSLQPSPLPQTPVRPAHTVNPRTMMVPPLAPFVLRHADLSHHNERYDRQRSSAFVPPSPSLPMPQELPRPMSSSALCPGVRVKWTAGSIGLTYPFQQHTDERLSFEPCGYTSDHDGEWLLLRSRQCLKYVMPIAGSVDPPPCRVCINIPTSAEYQVTLDHATAVKPHTPWDCLNQMQCRALMDKLQSQVRQLRLKVRYAANNDCIIRLTLLLRFEIWSDVFRQ